MPTYDYHCEKCHKSFEIRQSMKDAHLTVCPQESCRMAKWGHGRVKRAMGSGAGIIFKGSGFYTTDYRSDGYKKAAQKESAGNSAAGAGNSAAAKSGGDSATEKPKPVTPPAAPPPKPAAATGTE